MRYFLAALLNLAFLGGCNRGTPTAATPTSSAESPTKADAKGDSSTTKRADVDPVTKAADVSETGADKAKPADDVKEESVVPYDSKTNGALQVMTVAKDTGEWFGVQKDGKSVLSGAPPLLNSTVELAPGDYLVGVNYTERKVTIVVGKKTVLWTGDLMVQGKKGSGDYYAPFQGNDRRSATAEHVVNSPFALFAGKYSVRVFLANRFFPEVEVKAGKRTVVSIER